MRKLLQFLFALAALMMAPLQAQEAGEEAARIVAVGDLHGDYEAWRAIARQAGLITSKGRWAAGETILIQLGDITDRGPDSLKIIRHLQQIMVQAEKAGGQVIVLMGNHEGMNVTGDLRYVDPGEYEAFRDRRSEARREAAWKANQELIEAYYRESDPTLPSEQIKQMWFAEIPLGMLEHRRAWRPGGELGEWAASLPAVVRLGDILFVHGGLSEETTREPLEAVNTRYRAALAPGEDVDRSAIDDPLGPLWYRGNVFREPKEEPSLEDMAPDNATPDGAPQEAATPEETIQQEAPCRPSREEELALVLARYGAKRLIVAHTPSLSGIETDLGGRLIRVDTGISAYYGGPHSYLVIERGSVTAHQQGGDGQWFARSVPLGDDAEEVLP